MSGLTPGWLVSLLRLSFNSVPFFGNFAIALPIRPTTARPNILQDAKEVWAVYGMLCWSSNASQLCQ